MPIVRQDMLLAALAAGRSPFTAIHLEKLLFLIDHEAGLMSGTLARATLPMHQWSLFDGRAQSMLKILVEAGHVRPMTPW
jgi:hypothetical protein